MDIIVELMLDGRQIVPKERIGYDLLALSSHIRDIESSPFYTGKDERSRDFRAVRIDLHTIYIPYHRKRLENSVIIKMDNFHFLWAIRKRSGNGQSDHGGFKTRIRSAAVF